MRYSSTSSATLGLCSKPAAGAKIRNNGAAEESDAGDEGTKRPANGNVAALQEDIQQTEDEDEHCGFSHKG
jgi:hypothetical protein